MKIKLRYLSLVLISFATPLLLIACGSKKETRVYVDAASINGKTEDVKNALEKAPSYGFMPDIYLSPRIYNNIYDSLHDSESALVIIANHDIYIEKINVPNIEHFYVWDWIKTSTKFEFNASEHSSMGVFLNSFKMKGANTYIHGTNSAQNYGDYYPMYYIDHTFAQLGVSTQEIEAGDIVEITYDKY